jgi:hypothetical protein
MLNRRASDRAPAGAAMPSARPGSPEADVALSFGMPQDRAARIAARRDFVEMKQLFMRAAEQLEHGKGAWLRVQVRAAEEPTDLWVLRNPLLTALRVEDTRTRALRAELYRSLDNVFPERLSGDSPGLDRLPPLPAPWNARSGATRSRFGAFGLR